VGLSRLPIRVRMTIAFALALLLVLAGAGLFVYLRLRADLDEGVDAGLTTRANSIQAAARGPGVPPAGAGGGQPEESFAQLLDPGGRVLDANSGVHAPPLTGAQLAAALHGPVLFERRVEGIEGTARILARPLKGRSAASVVVVGQSLDDRNVALSGVVTSFVVGGALAVVLASALGYALASAGLAPVEAMRRRAQRVSLARDDERLPLPAAHDEIRRLGETLNDMLERLRRSFDRERRFVADASHELRTPVAVIKTELEAALRTGDYGAQVREALVAAVEECDHLAQLAEDLLVIARAGEGRLPVRSEELAIRPVLEGVREQFADRAAQHGREIRVDAPPELHMSADPLRLRQALGNLVDNALRHGAGEVVLRAARVPAGVELEVSDAGPGFGADIAQRAFERFTRGNVARTRGGTGLGMAIVQAVAEAHGGRATIEPGNGATVRIWLPGDATPHEDDLERAVPEERDLSQGRLS
jgi:two-component system OmpR family sensor kinase